MKRRIILFVTAAFCFIAANATVLQLMPRLLPGGRLPQVGAPVTRTIDVLTESNTINVSYLIPNIEVFEDNDLYPGRSFWKLGNFGISKAPGTPSYPIRNDMFVLPADASDIKVVLRNTSWKSIEYHAPTPARPPMIDSSFDTISLEDVPDISVESYVPAEVPVYINDILKCDDKCIVYVTFEPCVYDVETGITKVCYLADYSLSFVSNVDVTETVDNAERPENYLIITYGEYEKALTGFVKWKNQCGNKVQVKLADSWAGIEDPILRKQNLQNKIRETIKNAKSADANLKYVILAGSADELPGEKAKKHYYNNSVADTDYYYACVNEDDNVRNVVTGRFLVSSIDDMSNIVKKTILYEKGLSNDKDLSMKGVHLAYFQDTDNDGKEDRHFIHTSEFLRDKVQQYNCEIERIYKSTSTTKPSEMNDLEGSVEHAYLPAELLDDSFNWNPQYTDVINAINSGVQYALYRGHGAISFWDEPYFSVSHLKHLTNSNIMPVVFSISCNTGAFSDYGFAKNLMSLSNAGAVSVIASEDVSYSYYNDYLIRGIFNQFWNIDSLNHASINNPIVFDRVNKPIHVENNTLGNALHYGGMYLGMFASPHYTHVTKELFHVFGDPGLVFNTNIPWTREDISFKISKADNLGISWQYAELNTPIRSVIGYYNETTGEVRRVYGNSFTVPNNIRQNYYIVVQCYNYKPFIINVRNGIVTTSSPLASVNSSVGDINILSSCEGTINVSYKLADDAIYRTDAFIEIRDFNNSLICKEDCLDSEGKIMLNSSNLCKGSYVVRLIEDGHDVVYKKVFITQ